MVPTWIAGDGGPAIVLQGAAAAIWNGTVTSDTAEKKVTSFEVKGDFSPKEVFTALQAAGFTGKAGK